MILNTNKIFPGSTIDAACTHAKEVFPNESCGIISDDKYIPFENKSNDRDNSFLIKDDSFDELYMAGKVQAIIHSHNDSGHASEGDQIQQQELEVPFGIINLKNKSVVQVALWGEDVPTEPLLGRTFFFGVWDCFELVRDYLVQLYNITPPNPPREYGFWLKGKPVFEEFVQPGKIPFRQLSNFKSILPGDVLFYNLHGAKYINHCGIVMEDGLVLHHFENRVSTKTPLSFSQEFIKEVYRIDESLLINNYEGWDND